MLRLAVLLATLMVSGCSASSRSVAIENRDAAPYLLRVLDGRHRAWVVPAGTTGIGPTNDGSERRTVIIARTDCSEVGRYALGDGSVTMTVEDGAMADPDLRDTVAAGLSSLEQIVDPCP